MRTKIIDVSDQYLDDLCDWMIEWAEKDDSLTWPGFLRSRGIGQFYFNHFKEISDKVANTYECVKYTLHDRCVKKILTNEKLPDHQAKLYMKYLNLYDTHARQLIKEDRIAVAEAGEKTVEHHYIADNYGNRKLEGAYKSHFEKSIDKGRSSKKAK